MSNTAREYGQDCAHEKLNAEIPIITAGFVYVYLSNENESIVDVFYDQFSVELRKSPVINATDLYPYGAPAISYSREFSLKQDRLLNGKETQGELGYNVVDLGQRDIDPFVPMFPTIDRFAEKYHWMSPYQYTAGNPVNYIDVNGDSLWIAFGENNTNRILYQNGKLLNADGSQYVGAGVKVKNGKVRIVDTFLQSVVTELKYIERAEAKYGTDVIKTLQGSEYHFTIAKGVEHFDPGTFEQPYLFANQATYYMTKETGLSMQPFWNDKGQHKYDLLPANKIGSGGIIYWGGNTNSGTGLGHELFHGYDANTGHLIIDPLKDTRTSINNTNIGEIRASTFENRIRKANNVYPLREYYESGGHKLIDKKGRLISMPPAKLLIK